MDVIQTKITTTSSHYTIKKQEIEEFYLKRINDVGKEVKIQWDEEALHIFINETTEEIL